MAELRNLQAQERCGSPEVVQRLEDAARAVLGGGKDAVVPVGLAPVPQLLVSVGHHAAVHACQAA